MAGCVSMATMSCYKGPSASLALLTGSAIRTPFSLSVKPRSGASSAMALQCSFTPCSSLSLSSNSAFLGSSLGLGLNSSIGIGENRRLGLVVRASKYRLCQTKRNRSRKSLARTHGFRKRMSTTSGRATIKRRRAKGRWVLCTKTNHSTGKRI